MRKLLLHLILLNDVYSHSSSHSIHQPFRREPINMLEPLVENQSFIPQIGRLFTASAWEILHLRALIKDSAPQNASQESAPSETAVGTSNAPAASTVAQPEEAASNSADHPFAEFLPRKRLLAPQDGKGKTLTPEERNHVNIKSVLHGFSNVLQSTFSGEPIPRPATSAHSIVRYCEIFIDAPKASRIGNRQIQRKRSSCH